MVVVGSSHYLAKKYGTECQGITLSPAQVQKANALSLAEGLAKNVSFQVMNALKQPFPDGEFDLVFSMESGEHMPKKIKVSFQVVDALKQPFPDGQFDLVWSMESGEHMPKKMKFVGELARVASPGDAIVIVMWCHRDLSPSKSSLWPDEVNLLNKIYDAYYLPTWCSASDYVNIAKSLSLEDIRTADWWENVAPFWHAVIISALT